MKRVTIGSTVATLLFACFFILILGVKECNNCYTPQALMIKFIIIGLILFIGSIYYTRLYLKNEKEIFTIETIPLLDTNEAVADIPFSSEGIITADTSKILHSPYTDTRCVYYHSITEELRGSGKSRHWAVIENNINFIPFYIADDRGKLKIDITNIDSDFSSFKMDKNTSVPDPDFSEIDCRAVLSKEPWKEYKETVVTFFTVPPKRRSEYVLVPSTKVFVSGLVSRRNGELVLHEAEQYPLIISEKSKDQYINEFYKGGDLIYLVHLLTSLGFSIFIAAINQIIRMPVELFATSLVIGNTAILGSIFFTMYNRIITLKERSENALSNIDVELKRRAQLIPEIVSLVKQYTGYEKQLFEHITSIRVQMVSSQAGTAKIPQEQQLLALVEKYPSLKASGNYQQLMNALVDAEERIAYSRSFYNRNVRKLNTLVSQFPFVFIASLVHVGLMKYVNLVSGI